jgi:hypothetical protein
MKKGEVRPPLTKLLPKHRKFISEYLIDFNGKRAAQAAGYTEKSGPAVAHRFLRDKLIKDEISRLQGKQLATAGISAQFVLHDLRDIVTAVQSEKAPAFYQVRLRALELLGKHLNLWDASSNQDRQRRPHELTDKELIKLGMELQAGKDKEPKQVEAKITTLVTDSTIT